MRAIGGSGILRQKQNIKLTPAELDQLKRAIDAGELLREDLPQVAERMAELYSHPDRFKLAMSGRIKDRLKSEIHSVSSGIADPMIGATEAAGVYKEKGALGTIGHVAMEAVKTPFRAAGEAGKFLTTGEIEKPFGTVVGLSSFLPVGQFATAGTRLGLASIRGTRDIARMIPEARSTWRNVGRGAQVAGLVEGAREWPLELLGDVGLDVGIGVAQRGASRLLREEQPSRPQVRTTVPPSQQQVRPDFQEGGMLPIGHDATAPQPQPAPTIDPDTQQRIERLRANYPRWRGIADQFLGEVRGRPRTNVPLNLQFRNFADRNEIPLSERSELFDFIHQDVIQTENEERFEQGVAAGFVRWQSGQTANLPTRTLWDQYADAHGVPSERRGGIWTRIESSITGQADLSRRQEASRREQQPEPDLPQNLPQNPNPLWKPNRKRRPMSRPPTAARPPRNLKRLRRKLKLTTIRGCNSCPAVSGLIIS